MSVFEIQKAALIMSLRSHGINRNDVLRAIETVPREKFIPAAERDRAYLDQALPIEADQTISQPFIVAYMTQQLQPEERMKVLEIGTGSGYQAAILSHLCRRVYTIERHYDLLNKATQRFADLGLSDIVTRLGDGSQGWSEVAPFERIIVTAVASSLPQALCDQLADGGICVAPIRGKDGQQQLYRFIRDGDIIKPTPLLAVQFVPLIVGPPVRH